MSIEENKAVAQRWSDEIWGKGNLDAVDELFAADFVLKFPVPGMPTDREGQKQMVSMWRSASPGIQWTTEDMVAEGDKVVVGWSGRSTHKGEFMGIAPTGKQVTLRGMSLLHIAGGKIVEMWTETNMLEVMQQLGAKVG
jgi:steroid delta-isomerase-like uncharacterized protein